MTSSEGKELVQADASTTEAPEKVTVRSEQEAEDIAIAIVRARDIFEGAPHLKTATYNVPGCLYLRWQDLWRLQTYASECFQIDPSIPGAEVTFSNEAVSDAVQLNQTSLLSSSDTEVGDK